MEDSTEILSRGKRLSLPSPFHTTILRRVFHAVGAYSGAMESGVGPGMRIHCRYLTADHFVPTVERVWELGELFHFHVLCGVRRPEEESQLDAMLAELARLRSGRSHQHIAGVWFNHYFRTNNGNVSTDRLGSPSAIDHVVRYFQHEVRDLKHCPRRITFPIEEFLGGSSGWPSTCPRGEGVYVCRERNHPDGPECGFDCGVWEFRVLNQHSGHGFRVHFRPSNGASKGTHTYLLHLVFD
jgi:hypothetical protein